MATKNHIDWSKVTDRNYDNRPLEEDTELVMYFWDEMLAPNLKNPKSTLHKKHRGAPMKAMLVAFKKGEEADLARDQMRSYLDEHKGLFHEGRSEGTLRKRTSTEVSSLDTLVENEAEPYSQDADPLEMIIQGEGDGADLLARASAIATRLSEEAPQLMAAVIFHRRGIYGGEFEKAMRIEHDRSAAIQKNLTKVLRTMMSRGEDSVTLTVRKTRNDGYYRSIVEDGLGELLADLARLGETL